jgi:chromosome segregation ATPase
MVRPTEVTHDQILGVAMELALRLGRLPTNTELRDGMKSRHGAQGSNKTLNDVLKKVGALLPANDPENGDEEVHALPDPIRVGADTLLSMVAATIETERAAFAKRLTSGIDQEVRTTAARLQEAEGELEAAREAIERLEAEAKQNLAVIDDVRRDQLASQAEATALRDQLSAAEAGRRDLERELDAAQRRAEELAARQGRLIDEPERLRREHAAQVDRLTERIADAERAAREEREQERAERERVREASERIAERAEATIKDLRVQVEALTTEVVSLRQASKRKESPTRGRKSPKEKS